MIGLDTNILLRFLTQDDQIQSPIATRILQTELTEEEPGFVSVVVIVKLARVLESRYRQKRADVVAVIEGLTRINSLRLEHPLAVAAAVTAAVQHNADFTDALIGAIGLNTGCRTTLTFDRRAQRLPGFSAA